MPLCIEIDHLCKSFKENCVIQDLCLRIDEGEKIVFKGPSGIGKSTFLRCLTYLEPFQKGCVRIGSFEISAGMDVRKERAIIRTVRQQLGFVFQFFNLFPHLTVVENLTLGPVKVLGRNPREVFDEAMELLRRVGLEHKAKAYPHSLSGGQRQRVGIARALAMRPKAILFDEPTSSLDPEMKEEIVRVMEDCAKGGHTMLIVTHEPAFVERIATRLIKFGPQCRIESDEKIRE
jgi:polar amino acid transport system ATP-binding protein